MNLYAAMSNDPINRTDPTGMYDCGNNKKCDDAQKTAITKISGTIKELKGIQKTLDAGGKLSAGQQKLSDKVSKELGSGAGTNSKAIGGLIGAGNQMLGALNGNAPVTISSSGSDYARTENGGVTLMPNFFKSSPAQQASTMAHESAHLGAGAYDPTTRRGEIKGSNVEEYAKTHSIERMLGVADALTLSLGVDRDDGY
jgi:hypothetical protein